MPSEKNPQKDKKNSDIVDISDDGPTVGRRIIPAVFKVDNSASDSFLKRLLLYATGQAFSAAAWTVFIALALGIVFSIMVMVKAYLCPDVATSAEMRPSYCPRK